MKAITQSIKLLEIGSLVKIDLASIKDRLPEELKQKIIKDSNAKVLDYKITDGTQIGFLLELQDGSKNWFFNNEITNGNNIPESKNESKVSLSNYYFKNKPTYYGKSISYVLNPINFARWLRNSSKDIF